MVARDVRRKNPGFSGLEPVLCCQDCQAVRLWCEAENSREDARLACRCEWREME